MARAAADRPARRRSAAWARIFPIQYRLIRLLDPLIRAWWGRVGLGNVVELRVPGRRTGRQRRVLLGLLRDGAGLYVGHPNGDAAWTRNLEAAGTGELVMRPAVVVPVRAMRLADGVERDRAILATTQHVFPGNLIYRLARRHILAVGTYLRLEVGGEPAGGDGAVGSE